MIPTPKGVVQNNLLYSSDAPVLFINWRLLTIYTQFFMEFGYLSEYQVLLENQSLTESNCA